MYSTEPTTPSSKALDSPFRFSTLCSGVLARSMYWVRAHRRTFSNVFSIGPLFLTFVAVSGPLRSNNRYRKAALTTIWHFFGSSRRRSQRPSCGFVRSPISSIPVHRSRTSWSCFVSGISGRRNSSTIALLDHQDGLSISGNNYPWRPRMLVYDHQKRPFSPD
jgi:hypothetical protein